MKTKKTEPTTVEITKSDVTTGVELDGAKLTVLDKEGNIVDQWTSVKDQPHVIKRLTVGEEYTLREEIAPYGYLKATDVKFTLEDTAEIQKVEMKDEVPTGLLIINKNGEFLDKVTLLDNVKGTVEHLFEYVTGSLSDVTFDVFAAGITLNIFNKHSDRVKMANLAQIVNVLQAVLLTEGDKMIKTPTYHVFDIYKEHQDSNLVESSIEIEMIGVEEEWKVPNLTESVSETADGTLHLTITNLSVDQSFDIDTTIIDRSVKTVKEEKQEENTEANEQEEIEQEHTESEE